MGKEQDNGQKELGVAKSSRECYSMVRKEKPTANGMTWVKGGSQTCWAVIDATYLWSKGCKEKIACQTCIFGSK
jgi:hypothetical protein